MAFLSGLMNRGVTQLAIVWALLLGGTFLGSIVAPPLAADWTFTRGNCNGDENFDISDGIYNLNFLFGDGRTPACLEACNANDDRGNDISDATYVFNFLFGSGRMPPPPFLTCGVDPTPSLGCEGPLNSCPPDLGVAELLEPPEPSDSEPGDLSERADRPGQGSDTSANSVHLFSGEFYQQTIDLDIAGRGLDFSWQRTYRSRVLGDGPLGFGWDHSYNIFIERSGDDAILVHNGNGRTDLFRNDGEGDYVAPGLFQFGRFNGAFTMHFGNRGRWGFLPLDGSPAAGKIAFIADRNRNTIRFSYDDLGRLTNITDTLDRSIKVVYRGPKDHRISAVIDFMDRTVRYGYYYAGDPGGNDGDLKSMTTPTVNETPTMNEFPNGKTTVYTYSRGFDDDLCNHNLLTITDPKGQTYLQNFYSETTDPQAIDYDRLVRQIWGGPKDIIDITYVERAPKLIDTATIRTIVNDQRGLVKEYFYNSFNRCVAIREYTGFANPLQPTTPTENRPQGRLRAADPEFYEIHYGWNADSLLTQIDHPNGNVSRFVYESDVNPEASPVERGNLRELHRLPGKHSPVGDQDQISEFFDYEPGFGGPSADHFVRSHRDANGNVTGHEYDDAGNRVRTTHRLPSIVEDMEYNQYGQLAVYTHPDSGDGESPQRRRDAYTYHTEGSQRGYVQWLVVDAVEDGFLLVTQYEYDAAGNVVRVVDPNGNDTQYVVNELDQIVREISRPASAGDVRYHTDHFYDANDNLVRSCILNVDGGGKPVLSNAYLTVLYEYDILNYVTQVCEESGSYDVPRSPPQLDCDDLPDSEFVRTQFEYGPSRLIEMTRYGEAGNGNQRDNVLQLIHDERDLQYRVTYGAGDGEVSDQYSYDRNGNLVEALEGIEPVVQKTGLVSGPRRTTYVYDAFNRLVSETDPMDNVTVYHYDANDNLVGHRTEGELFDVVGAAGNLRLEEEAFRYDEMDRLIRLDKHFFVPETQKVIGDGFSTTRYEYNDNSQTVLVVDDNGHEMSFSYDTLNRLRATTDPSGNMRTLGYDGNSNVVEIAEMEVGPGVVDQFISRYAYDGLDRLISETDPVGNTDRYVHDSRDNVVETIDALGNVTRTFYDGLSREVQTDYVLTANGAGDGDPIGTIRNMYAWDDSSRLVARVDDNGNTTTYRYDGLDRYIAVVYADGTQTRYGYDVHDNVTSIVDANGSLITAHYDLLDREIERGIVPGQDVSKATSREVYAYDGLSRLVSAEDNDSLVLFAHDSLSHVVGENLNGATTISTFDGVGNRLSLTYPGGRHVISTYDRLDRKALVEDADGTIARYSYVGPERVLTCDLGNNTRGAYEYSGVPLVSRSTHVFNPAGRVTTIDDRIYEWDPEYNKVARDDVRKGGSLMSQRYFYDSVYRLTRSIMADGMGALIRDSQYGFDGVGNRLAVVDDFCSGKYGMDDMRPYPADFQMNQYTRTGCDTRVYDSQSNLSSMSVAGAPSVSLVYDYRDQLVQYTDLSGTTYGYVYDALSRRIEKRIVLFTRPDIVVQYVYSDFHVIEEQNVAGSTVATYVYGEHTDEILSMRRRSPATGVETDYFYHCDDLGNVVALTTNTTVERYRYHDFGAPFFFDGGGQPISSSAVGNPYLWNGRRYDPESGLYYYRTRYLDPRAGRFITRDTIGVWGDSGNMGNAFSYVGNNPWTHTDPNGEGKEVFTPVKPHLNVGAIGLISSLMKSPRDAASGLPTGKRQHKPFVVTKPVDKSAAAEGERIMLPEFGAGVSSARLGLADLDVMGTEHRKKATKKKATKKKATKKKATKKKAKKKATKKKAKRKKATRKKATKKKAKKKAAKKKATKKKATRKKATKKKAKKKATKKKATRKKATKKKATRKKATRKKATRKKATRKKATKKKASRKGNSRGTVRPHDL